MRRASVGSFVCLLLAFLLTSCATQTRALLHDTPADLPRSVELSSTPFHPQQRYQCGPAALATALNAAGINIEPEALISQVYVPAREGSLPPEMLSAARRNGAIGMTIPQRMDALLAEVAAGNPVIVLQNLSLAWAPLWHYAVVIGYDLGREELLLRSGTTERLSMSLSTFEHTWARGGYWGMVALAAGRLPASVEEANAVDALVAFEKAAGAKPARKTYESALRRWPRNPTLLLGLGNATYATGDRKAAVLAFRQATEVHPENAAAFNNLASVLFELGEIAQARAAAERAVALGGPWRDTAQATLQSILVVQQRRGK